MDVPEYRREGFRTIAAPADPASWTPPLPEVAGFEHAVVETPGLRTHVASVGRPAGTGSGEPVVMLHGFPQHWWQWREIAPAVAAHGHRVVCPDLRGAGWTEAESPSIARDTRLHDLLAVLDVLGIDRFHLVSHDMGALTATQLSYEHPERVLTAVQLSVPPFTMTFSPRAVPGFRHLPGFIWHRPGASLAGTFSPAYVARPLSRATVDTHLAPFQRPEVDAAVRPLLRRHILPEALRMSSGHYRRRRLTVPTLVVLGRRDRPWTEDLMQKVCKRPERYADRLEFAYVDDAAHFITDDAPAGVSRLVVDWIERAG